MITIRHNIFETNSSATHALAYTGGVIPACVDDIELRNPNDLPELTEDGYLDIELSVYWDCSDEVYDLDLSDIKYILEYLASHAVFSSRASFYSRKNTEYKDTFEENHVAFLHDIQEAYNLLGKTPPKDVRPYFYTTKHEKFYITKENKDSYFNGYSDSCYCSLDEHNKYIQDEIKKDPTKANWPICNTYIGLVANDLISGSYVDAAEYFHLEHSNYDFYLDAIEVITHKVTLTFYHT